MSAPTLIDLDAGWSAGVASHLTPDLVPPGSVWAAENVLVQDGLISVRPGYSCVARLPSGRLQGGTLFQPSAGSPQFVVAVDGVLYAAVWPFIDFRVVHNVRLSTDARQVFWCVVEQAAERVGGGEAPALRVLESARRYLVVQDGGLSGPVFYNGGEAFQVVGDQYGPPSGGVMAWAADRLWIARGNQLYASDISDPLSFREQLYLGGIGYFLFPDDITAMQVVSATERPVLMVFTKSAGFSVQAFVRNRNSWPTVANFIDQAVPVGCVGHRAVCQSEGLLTWFSPHGFTTLDMAVAANTSLTLPVKDAEMAFSKVGLASDLSGVCAATYDRYVLFSVPYDGHHNSHTWVYVTNSFPRVTSGPIPAWSGVWTGTWPVEWAVGEIVGVRRAFFVSSSPDGQNTLWEAFQSPGLDNGLPVTWSVWTRAYFGLTSKASKLPGSRVRFGFASIQLVNVTRDLDVGVWYSGGLRGAWHQIAARGYRVLPGGFVQAPLDANSTVIVPFRGQSRLLRTADSRMQPAEGCPPGVENDRRDSINDCFQLRIVGHGPAAIHSITVTALATGDVFHSASDAFSVDEVASGSSAISGQTVSGDPMSVLDAVNDPVQQFTASKTVTASFEGRSVTLTRSASSPISQAAADRLAEAQARVEAEAVLISQTLPLLGSA